VNAPANRFRLMSDEELRDAAARLDETVKQLQQAAGEIGLRIRLTYSEALDAARCEIERRAA